MSKLKEKAGQLARYLQSRQLPMEGEELKYKTQQIHNKVTANGEYTQCRCVSTNINTRDLYTHAYHTCSWMCKHTSAHTHTHTHLHEAYINKYFTPVA